MGCEEWLEHSKGAEEKREIYKQYGIVDGNGGLLDTLLHRLTAEDTKKGPKQVVSEIGVFGVPLTPTFWEALAGDLTAERPAHLVIHYQLLRR